MKKDSGKCSKISLVVPVYNEEENLPGFLEDIVKQTVIPEVVFVIYPARHYDYIFDTVIQEDKTFDIIAEYSKKYKQIKYLETDIKGTGVAINDGIIEVSGDFVMVANADFRFKSDKVFEELGTFLKKDMDIVKVVRTPEPRDDLTFMQNVYRAWDVRSWHYISFTLIRKDLFPEYPNISYGEDRIAMYRLKQKNPTYILLMKDYGFERGNYKKFNLFKFIKRYWWYGSTYRDFRMAMKSITLPPAPKPFGWVYKPMFAVLAVFAEISFITAEMWREVSDMLGL